MPAKWLQKASIRKRETDSSLGPEDSNAPSSAAASKSPFANGVNSAGFGRGTPAREGQKRKLTENKIQNGFTEAIQVLESHTTITTLNEFHLIMVPIKTEHYFKLVVESWEQLRAIRFKASQQFSLAEWLHVHALFLYGRIQQVQQSVLGEDDGTTIENPLNSIQLNKDAQVYLPVWSALACIGILDDSELCIRYLPSAVMPQSQSEYSAEELAHILNGTLYDWNRSWNRVLESRKAREVKHLDPEPRSTEELMQAIWKYRRDDATVYHEQLSQLIQEIRDARDYTLRPPCENEYSPSLYAPVGNTSLGLSIMSEPTVSENFDLDSSANTAIAERGDLEDAEQISKSNFRECHVHYDPQLWSQYQDFVGALYESARFAPMPVSVNGSTSWILPVMRSRRNGPLRLRMPRSSISKHEQAMALILQTSNIRSEISQTWYVETEIAAEMPKLLESYVLSGLY